MCADTLPFRRATQIFQRELSTQIEYMEESLSLLNQGYDFTEEERNHIVNLLHRIKGGSSFLQLDEIHATALTAETYFQSLNLGEGRSTNEDIAVSLLDFINCLSEFAKKLRAGLEKDP